MGLVDLSCPVLSSLLLLFRLSRLWCPYFPPRLVFPLCFPLLTSPGVWQLTTAPTPCFLNASTIPYSLSSLVENLFIARR